MADRVAVFNQGRIEQVGTPEEVYDRPATAFVAGFVGSRQHRDRRGRRTPHRRAPAPFSLRPERIRLGAAGEGEIGATGRACSRRATTGRRRGSRWRSMPGRCSTVERANAEGAVARAGGRPVGLAWRRDAMRPLADRP